MSDTHESPSNRPAVPAGASASSALINQLQWTRCTIVAADVPNKPGCSRYDIAGPDRDAVWGAMTKMTRDAADAGADASFEGPFRFQGKYFAVGFVRRQIEAA